MGRGLISLLSVLSLTRFKSHSIFLVAGVASHREGVAGGLAVHQEPRHGEAAVHGALTRQGVPRPNLRHQVRVGVDRTVLGAPAPHP